MNSKEALDEMFDLLNYEQTGICGDRNLYRIIAKDLDRLEMLEKILEKQNKLLNETKNSVYKVLEDLGKINEENIKLKKAIKLLKEHVALTKDINVITSKLDVPVLYSLEVSKEITQQEYDLLDEVLTNDK